MEEEQQQAQPQIKSTPYASPMYNFGSSIITLTNPENKLNRMELTLRSCNADDKGNPVPVGEPLLNEIGIRSVMGMVETIVDQDTVMSNLNKDNVPMLMDFLGDTLAKDLMINRIKYEIKTPSARDKIYFTVLTSSFICMKRASEEGERRFWKGSQQDITTRVEGMGGQKKSLFSKALGWGNK